VLDCPAACCQSTTLPREDRLRTCRFRRFEPAPLRGITVVQYGMLRRWSGWQSIALHNPAMRLLRLSRRPRRASLRPYVLTHCSRFAHLLAMLGNTFCAFFSPAAPTVRLPYRVQSSVIRITDSPIPKHVHFAAVDVGLRVTHPASYAERMCPCVIERCVHGLGKCPSVRIHNVSIRFLGLNCPQTQWISPVRGPQCGSRCI
jgi:hypothetical protein